MREANLWLFEGKIAEYWRRRNGEVDDPTRSLDSPSKGGMLAP